MKTIAMLGCLMLCTVVVGCDTQTEQDKILDQRVQEFRDDLAAWEAAQDASYALADTLEEGMPYDGIVELFGSTGEQKMNAQAGEIQRTIFEWALDGDVFVKATFDDGILKKWETN